MTNDNAGPRTTGELCCRSMPTAYLVHGYLGAGKTTLAKQLERGLAAAVRFSPDEWMTALYGHDPPADQFSGVFERVCRMLNDTWPRVLRVGVDVILDFGFWRRSWRDDARALAAGRGAEVVLYDVHCDEDLARERCRRRNAEPSGSFYMDDSTFDALRAGFEPLGVDEPCIRIDTSSAEVCSPGGA
jgi:predicted kinase